MNFIAIRKDVSIIWGVVAWGWIGTGGDMDGMTDIGGVGNGGYSLFV